MEYYVLAHCPDCDLWLEVFQSCPHISDHPPRDLPNALKAAAGVVPFIHANLNSAEVQS